MNAVRTHAFSKKCRRTDMITKELFVEVLGLIKEQHEIDSKVADGLELVCDGYVVYGCKNKCHDALRKVLEIIFDDKEDYIGWWLYDDVEHIVSETIDGETIKYDLTSPEALYDFLVREKEIHAKKKE